MTQHNNPGNPQFSKGPQFRTGGGWGEKLSEWIRNNFSTVILPVIALIVLIGGIYLYTRQNEQDILSEETLKEDTQASLEDNILDEINAEAGNETADNAQKPDAETGTGGPENIKEPDIKPEQRVEDGNIISKAGSGDGVTHLARRALNKYLETEKLDVNLTPEHKIYIEDYLKDKKGSRPLKIGDEISFSKDLIKQAIEASQKLSETQLKNLEKYTALVPSL